MSGISKFKGIYTEGVSFEIGSGHKGAQRQTKIANLAARTTNPGEKEAAEKKLKGPKLPSVRNEETELDEGMTIQDFKKQRSRQKQKAKRAAEKTSPTRRAGMTSYERAVRHRADVDPDYDYGDEERVYPGGISKNPKKIRKAKALGEIGEAIDVGADVGKTISDFVHSKSKTFKGDSKKQRIKRALGAYYAAQKEETENIYNYVIETLVDADFAQDYETAENMFEHMSSEFVAVILEEYIEEKARGTRPKRTVHAYDVDETLFRHGKKGKPNVQVHVKDESGKRVQSLSNQEFNTHKLEKGHSYDFGEFQSAKKFRETSTPNKKVVKHIQKKVARGENVHLITARSKFDDPKEFHAHLKQHGIHIPLKNIHYTGGMKGSDVGDKKVTGANAIAKKHDASKVHMYDDAAKVHKSFEAEKKNKPTSKKIKTHMVAPGSDGESRVRSFQATKGGTTGGPEKTTKEKQRARKKARKNMGEEMTSYEYWKQFI